MANLVEGLLVGIASIWCSIFGFLSCTGTGAPDSGHGSERPDGLCLGLWVAKLLTIGRSVVSWVDQDGFLYG